MAENELEKENQEGEPESTAADKEAIQVAEEDAHASLPATMRLGGQTVHTLKKLYYKLAAGQISQLQQQIIDQDRELSELSHDVGELTAELIQINRLLKGIEARLASLEAKFSIDTDEKGLD